MLKYNVLFIIIFGLMLILQQYRMTLRVRPDNVRLIGCLRTKDSREYIEEYINYYIKMGVSKIHLYDDSEIPIKDLIYPHFRSRVQYTYVGNSISVSENDNIWKCYLEVLIHDLTATHIVNLDDDEFIFPRTNNESIVQILSKLPDMTCVTMPIYFFGTKNSTSSALTLKRYTNRDADVRPETKIKKLYVSRHYHRYKNANGKRVVRRIRKVIYDIRNKREDLLHQLGLLMRQGELIHGFNMGCFAPENPQLAVAHYTREMSDLEWRVSKFWKSMGKIKGRFKNEKDVQKYFRERDRNEFEDKTLTNLF